MLHGIPEALCVSMEGLDNWDVGTEVYGHAGVLGIRLRSRPCVVQSDVARLRLHYLPSETGYTDG